MAEYFAVSSIDGVWDLILAKIAFEWLWAYLELGEVDFHESLDIYKHYQTSRPSAGPINTHFIL